MNRTTGFPLIAVFVMAMFSFVSDMNSRLTVRTSVDASVDLLPVNTFESSSRKSWLTRPSPPPNFHVAHIGPRPAVEEGRFSGEEEPLPVLPEIFVGVFFWAVVEVIAIFAPR